MKLISNFLKLFICTLCLFSKVYGQKTKPNLVFVFSDQQPFDMIGCYGNKQIKTPVIDQLAAEGVRFEYCISSSPVCSAFRSMLLTGQHPLQNGAISNDFKVITDDIVPFGQALKNDGYRTGYVGKWHLFGGDCNRAVPKGSDRWGFDTFLSNNCMLDFSPEAAFYFNEKGKKVKFNKWEVYEKTDQVVDFIKEDSEDPYQQHNLFYDPNYTEIRQELFEKSLEWMRKYDDTMVSKNEITLLLERIKNRKIKEIKLLYEESQPV